MHYARPCTKPKGYSISTAEIAQHAYYNLGNIAFNDEKYDQSIAFYKDALRIKPEDMDARENLRLLHSLEYLLGRACHRFLLLLLLLFLLVSSPKIWTRVRICVWPSSRSRNKSRIRIRTKTRTIGFAVAQAESKAEITAFHHIARSEERERRLLRPYAADCQCQ